MSLVVVADGLHREDELGLDLDEPVQHSLQCVCVCVCEMEVWSVSGGGEI